MFVVYNVFIKTINEIQSMFGNFLDFMSDFHHEKRENA